MTQTGEKGVRYRQMARRARDAAAQARDSRVIAAYHDIAHQYDALAAAVDRPCASARTRRAAAMAGDVSKLSEPRAPADR